MRVRRSLPLVLVVVLTVAGCARENEITAPSTPAHNDASVDSLKRGPGTFGGGA